MYAIALYNESDERQLDPTLAPDVTFSTIVQAVNYALHHCVKNDKFVLSFSDVAPGIVTIDIGEGATASYRVVPLIHITSTQYGYLMQMDSPKLVTGRIVISADELDDLVSNLLYGVSDHAIVKPAMRIATIATLIDNMPEDSEVEFGWLDLPIERTYTDIAALRVLLAKNIESA